MLLKHQEHIEKECIAIDKRLDKLYRLKWKSNWVPVEPYQDGWEIYPVLRDDAARRLDAPELQLALNHCYSTYFTKDPKLVSSIRKAKTEDNCYKYLISGSKGKGGWYFGPTRREFSLRLYDELPEVVKKYMYSWNKLSWGNSYYKTFQLSRDYLPSYYIIYKVRPRIIRFHSEVDPEVLKEISFLEARLKDLDYSRGWHRRWRKTFDKGSTRMTVRVAKSKFLKGELEDIPSHKRDLKLNVEDWYY